MREAIWIGVEGMSPDFGSVYYGKPVKVTKEQEEKHRGNLEFLDVNVKENSEAVIADEIKKPVRKGK